jgi:hypothetical protein
LFFELSCSPRVGGVFGVLTAIQLDHNSVFGTGEIDDVLADRMLPAKFVPH